MRDKAAYAVAPGEGEWDPSTGKPRCEVRPEGDWRPDLSRALWATGGWSPQAHRWTRSASIVWVLVPNIQCQIAGPWGTESGARPRKSPGMRGSWRGT